MCLNDGGHSKPWYGNEDNIDDSGKYIDLMFVHDCLGIHIFNDGMNDYQMNERDYLKSENKPKVVTVFESKLEDDFWMKGLKKYYYRALIISDRNSYLSKDSKRCHRLYLISSESTPSLEVLLEKKGISVSDYSAPQFIHKDKYANLYKMIRTKYCKDKIE